MPIVTTDFDGISRPQKIAYDIGAYEYVGTTWYVDNSGANGNGSSASPFNSIQNAFNNAALAAGDHIKIRTGTGTYTENAKPPAGKNGTSSALIVVEPDTAATPNLRWTGGSQSAAIQLEDVNYWRVQNLTFNGAGVTTSLYAVWVRCVNSACTGNEILNNTFLNWGGAAATDLAGTRPVQISGRSSVPILWTSNTLVRGNTVTNCRAIGINNTHANDTLIDNNIVSSMQEGRITAGGAVTIRGIQDGTDSNRTIISNNIIHDHESWSSTILTGQGSATWTGIWTDVNGDSGTIIKNIVYNIGQDKGDTSNSKGTSWEAIGLFVESRCDNWTVSQNIVYNIGTTGCRNGSSGTTDPNNTIWTNNTIFNINPAGTIGIGILINRGFTLTIENNIVMNASKAQIQVASTAVAEGPHTIDYNDYWDTSGGNKVGMWGDGVVRPFSGTGSWKAVSGQDAHSKNQNPLFVSTTPGSEDFHLQIGSPCIGTGFNGVTMGALPFIGIANVATNSVGDTTFSDTWTTVAAADTQTAFGTTTAYGGLTAKNISSVTSHADIVLNLNPNVLYHFKALSGGSSSSDQLVITNLPPATSLSMS